MKRLAVIVLMLISSSVPAAICPTLEFAEIASFSKEELLRIRCEYHTKGMDFMDTMTMDNSTSRRLNENEARLELVMQCSADVRRMDRVLARSYKLTEQGLDLFVKINSLCH